VGAANVGAGFAIGFGRDAAGVYDDHIGLGGQSVRCSGGTKESGYGFAVSAGSPAAKVLDVEGRGHRFKFSGVSGDSALRALAELARCARSWSWLHQDANSCSVDLNCGSCSAGTKLCAFFPARIRTMARAAKTQSRAKRKTLR